MVGWERPAAPGDVIAGRYRIEAWLGQGNMAAVFRAIQLATDRAVALKLIHAHLVERSDICELFIREARVGARIGKHPHIVDVLDAGIDERRGVPFLVMELLDGDTLDRHAKGHGPMSPSLVRTLFLQLADALDQAHAAGVVHRDLKPGNLFLTRGRKSLPCLKVVDFGIAKVLEHDAGRTATQIGSPAYAAPEQLGAELRSLAAARGITIAQGVSPATDIWPLGLIAYELLVGAPPAHFWHAQTGVPLIEMIMTVVLAPTPVASVRAGMNAHRLPRGFDAWIDRCLHKNAADRWPSAIEAVEHLVMLLDEGYDEAQTVRRRSDRPVLLRSRSVPPPQLPTSETAPLPDTPIPLVRPAMTSSPEELPPAPAIPSFAEEAATTAATQPFLLSKAPSDTVSTVSIAPPRTSTANVRDPSPVSTELAPTDHLPAPNPIDPPTADAAIEVLVGAEPSSAIAPSSTLSTDTAVGAGTHGGLGGTTPPREARASRPWGRLAGVAAFLAIAVGTAYTFLFDVGKLTIVVKGSGGEPITAAEVFVDDQKRCHVAPCVITNLRPGRRTIKVLAAGAPPLGPFQETIGLGQEKTITFTAMTPPPRLKLAGQPAGAKVLVDGELEGTLPLALEGLSPGLHKLRIEGGPRYQALERTIDVVPGQDTDIGLVNLMVQRGLLTLERITPGTIVTLVDRDKHETRITEERWRHPPVKIELDPAAGWKLIARRAGYVEQVQSLSFDAGVAERIVRVELAPLP